ncbi:helix-turn-helix domain-containing protein [Mycobacterium marseillense]|uniref:helix-turn-helix domain-containing protein n=1 Tax=Mycobacterium marseillense TaxID=701042 RepID=UPI0011A6BD48|nr:helix-turn-helix domain-containing protein [Mycobacterium marseillense]
MNLDTDRLLLPYSEAMAALGGISRTKVWELTRDGELVCVKIGARAFITAKSIAEYVDRLTAAATA